MRKNLWIAAAALVLVLGAAGYTIAQSTDPDPQGGPGWMMGPGMGMMGGGMMGQGGQGGQGGMMGPGMMGMMQMMSGQPLTEEQFEQFAKLHGITVEQAKQMTDACTQVMRSQTAPQTPQQ
jgi:hypothetical protein